jgi:hypothetical protein
MHVLLIYYYVGSWVRLRVFCARRYGCGCSLLPMAGYGMGAGLEFNLQVRVYISRTRG